MILQISHITQQMKEEIFSHTIAKKYISAPWNQDFKIMEASAEHNFGSKRLGGMLGASCILCFCMRKYLSSKFLYCTVNS
jgi:hypothetical protein